MRKLTFLLLFVFAAHFVSADELTPAQKKCRSNIMEYLKTEGYAPYVDPDDESITFKKEGTTHWITIEENAPFFISFFMASGWALEGENAVDRDYAIVACNEVNRTKKAAKAYCSKKFVYISVELFCASDEEFKSVFYRNLSVLSAAYDGFVEAYNSLVEGEGTSAM